MIGRIFYNNFDLFEKSIEDMEVIRCKNRRGYQLAVFFKVNEGYYFGFERDNDHPFTDSVVDLYAIFEAFYESIKHPEEIVWIVEKQRFDSEKY